MRKLYFRTTIYGVGLLTVLQKPNFVLNHPTPAQFYNEFRSTMMQRLGHHNSNNGQQSSQLAVVIVVVTTYPRA